MVNLLGATLPDRKLVKIALQAFYGVNRCTSAHIMARLQFHDQLKVSELSESQLNALSALLSAPEAAPRPSTPLAPFSVQASTSSSASISSSSPPDPSSSASASSTTTSTSADLIPRDPPPATSDPLAHLVIEDDLRRRVRADIAHHRNVGTLTGRYHAMGLPVRGQRNRTNGKTAKKLNRIERRGFATFASPPSSSSSSSSSLSSSSITPSSLWTASSGSRVLQGLAPVRWR